jgi:hypothetical protein
MAKIKGITFNLAGDDYEIPPLSLGDLERLQDKIAAVKEGSMDVGTVSTILDATHAALRRNYPDVTREQVADMVDVSNMADVFRAVMDVSGLIRKEIEAGKQ